MARRLRCTEGGSSGSYQMIPLFYLAVNAIINSGKTHKRLARPRLPGTDLLAPGKAPAYMRPPVYSYPSHPVEKCPTKRDFTGSSSTAPNISWGPMWPWLPMTLTSLLSWGGAKLLSKALRRLQTLYPSTRSYADMVTVC